MITIDKKNNQLVIVIKTTSPDEEREYLLQALAAAFRWRGNTDNGDAYTDDGQNLIRLAQLQEALLTV